MSPHTIEYLGYKIDPVDEAGRDVPVDFAICFKIFPPDENEPCLEGETYTLETAKEMVELDIDIREGAPF